MQVFIHIVDPHKTTNGVTKSNGTLVYIHWTGELSRTRLPVMCLEFRPIWVTCLSLGLKDSVVQYDLFSSVEVNPFRSYIGPHPTI
jgi:hypothetical protein